MIGKLKKNEVKSAVKIGVSTILSKYAENVCKSYEMSLNTVPILDEEYDLAISYYNPTSYTIAYVINNVKAKKKVMWIHNDVNLYKDILDYRKYYEKYNYIFNVSKVGAEEFLRIFPSLKNKVGVFYNIIDEKTIKEKSVITRNLYGEEFEGIKIATVARLSIEKGQDMIPEIARRFIDDGINIKWYCLGEGSFRKEIEENVEKYKVKDNVILLGNIDNPFPYIKQCDVYVQTSRSECYCTTVMEAKALKKPMVITNVNGSIEQINDGVNGFISDYTVDSIYGKLKILLEDKSIREKFQLELLKESVDTATEMKKLYALV